MLMQGAREPLATTPMAGVSRLKRLSGAGPRISSGMARHAQTAWPAAVWNGRIAHAGAGRRRSATRMPLRVAVTVLACSLMLATSVGPLGAAAYAAVSRITDVERSVPPFGFDHVKSECPGSTVARDRTRAHSGFASLRAHYEAEGCSPFARGIFDLDSPHHVGEGDEARIGAAVFLPRGFYAAHRDYTDIVRLDSYVNDDGDERPDVQRQQVALASLSDDRLSLRTGPATGPDITLIGPLPTSRLPEGRWNLVEVNLRVSEVDGRAFSELKFNGVSQGTAPSANRFEGRADYNRVRYGLVSAAGSGSGDLTLYVDRAIIHTSEGSRRNHATELERQLARLWRMALDLLLPARR